MQYPVKLPPYRQKDGYGWLVYRSLFTLSLPGMVQTVLPNSCPWSTIPSWDSQRAHISCNSGLLCLQWCWVGHPPTIFTWFSSLQSRDRQKVRQFRDAEDALAFIEAVILDIPISGISVVWCYIQLIWEDSKVCRGWWRVLWKIGVDRLALSIVVKPDCET